VLIAALAVVLPLTRLPDVGFGSFSTETVEADVRTCPLRPESDRLPTNRDVSLRANNDRFAPQKNSGRATTDGRRSNKVAVRKSKAGKQGATAQPSSEGCMMVETEDTLQQMQLRARMGA